MAGRLSPAPGRRPGRVLWQVVAVLAGGVGLCVALLALRPSDLGASALLGAGVCGVVVATAGEDTTLRRIAVASGWGSVAGPALAGLVVVSGWLALLILVVLLVGLVTPSGPLRLPTPSRVDTQPSEPPAQAHDEVGDLTWVNGVDPSLLSDAELCLAWRRSYLHLLQAGSATSRLRVAARRQALLDEIERRHPAAFAAWLESGARAAGNPQPFLTRIDEGRDRREDLPPAAA